MRSSLTLTVRRTGLALIGLWLAACQAGAPAATAPAVTPAPAGRVPVEQQPIAGGPTLLRSGLTVRKIADAGAGAIRLARNPVDGAVYVLNPASGLARVSLGEPGTVTPVAAVTAIFTDAVPAGLAIGPQGDFYLSGNRPVGRFRTQAVIRRGRAAANGTFTWTTLAVTDPYPLSATPFDHLVNGLAVSPDGRWLYVNSGSRTDHGEVENNTGSFPKTREVPLSARIFRLPADAAGLELPNDEAGLDALGVVFARGTRNSYDLTFAPNGELFAGDNGPDADLPDELNWLRAGRHYGFPWRFGDQDNPTRSADYVSFEDRRLSPDFTAVKTGTYKADPGFPAPPAELTDPLPNRGPAASHDRTPDGEEHDAAAEGRPLFTFTPHRAPLGLVFVDNAQMPADLQGANGTLSAFILSWGAAGGTLSDQGQDLLHLWLTPDGGSYTVTAEQWARGFTRPMDALLIENRLVVLEYGATGALWEITFNTP